MANLKVFLLSIFLIFAIMTTSITTEEAAAATENKAEVNAETNEEEAHNEEHEEIGGEDVHDVNDDETDPGDAQGNILDEEAGKEELKNLGFDTKEFLTTEEMRTLYTKVLLKAETADAEEKAFYEKLIEKVMKEVPEQVKQADIRNFFEIPFLMKYVEQGEKEEEGENMAEGAEATPKEDM